MGKELERWGGHTGFRGAETGATLPSKSDWSAQRTISSASLVQAEDEGLVLGISNRGRNRNHHGIKTRSLLN